MHPLSCVLRSSPPLPQSRSLSSHPILAETNRRLEPQTQTQTQTTDFAVAMWGKDFDAGDHAGIVQRSATKGYRPTVDVFLPVCKEPLHLLANTWRHVAALDYPDVKVFVLDDGKSQEVKALAASFGFECEV